MFTRFLPFVAFGKKARESAVVRYLGAVLPFAIMGMLVVYCLKDVNFLAMPFGIPELLGCVFTAGLYVWRKNVFLSIGAGTVFYMLLVQLVFK